MKLVTGRSHELNWMLSELLKYVEARYLQVKQQASRVNKDYLDRLFWKDELHQFQTQDLLFTGVIEGVDSAGRLCVRKEDDGLESFAAREIWYVI